MKAIGLQKTARVTVKGSWTQGTDSLEAQGRLHFQPGKATAYDLTVRNPYDDSFGTARLILLDDCAYYRDNPQKCNKISPRGRADDDEIIWMAGNARWMSTPYNIYALLHTSTSLKTEADTGTITYHGTSRGSDLAGQPAVTRFYASDHPVDRATFTLLTGTDDLPKRLDLDLWTTVQPGVVYHSLFSAAYSDWGKSGTITSAY